MIEYNFESKQSVIVSRAIFAFVWVMSNWCLLRLFLGNPGFVRDFIRSEEIIDNESGEERLAIFSVEDYEKRQEMRG